MIMRTMNNDNDNDDDDDDDNDESSSSEVKVVVKRKMNVTKLCNSKINSNEHENNIILIFDYCKCNMHAKHHISIVTAGNILLFWESDVAQLKNSASSTKNLSHNYIAVKTQLHLSLFDFLKLT